MRGLDTESRLCFTGSMETNTPNIERLIEKSIKARIVEVHGEKRTDRQQGAAMLQAFSDVAADVLNLVIAPSGWRILIAECVRGAGELPRIDATNPASIERYKIWMASVIQAVTAKVSA